MYGTTVKKKQNLPCYKVQWQAVLQSAVAGSVTKCSGRQRYKVQWQAVLQSAVAGSVTKCSGRQYFSLALFCTNSELTF